MKVILALIGDLQMLAAYGWPAELADEEILARLLALNLERAAGAA